MWYVLVSTMFICEYIGPTLAFIVILQPCVFYVLRLSGSKLLIWIASLFFLISMMYFNWFLVSVLSVNCNELLNH